MHAIHSRQTGPKRQPVPSKRHSCRHTPRLSYSLFLIFKDSWHCQISLPLRLPRSQPVPPAKLFYFLCHCLNFLSPISFSLPLFQASSFSHTNHLFSFCLQTFPPCLPPGGIRFALQCAGEMLISRWCRETHGHINTRKSVDIKATWNYQYCLWKLPEGLINV